MRRTSRERTLFLAGGFVVVAVVYYALALDPLWRDWNTVTRELATNRAELQRLQRRANKPDLTALAEQVRPEFGELLDSDSEAQHTAAKMQTLEAACQVSGMHIGSYHPLAPTVAGEHWRRFPLKVVLDGDLAGLTDLLLRLNRGQRLLDLERLDLRTNARGETLGCDLVVSSFSYSEASLRKSSRRRAAPTPLGG